MMADARAVRGGTLRVTRDASDLARCAAEVLSSVAEAANRRSLSQRLLGQPDQSCTPILWRAWLRLLSPKQAGALCQPGEWR